ncbi:MAG: T9SS type A sorting domain-containing protein [Bacteroidota bacterium]|nr:T9SS type A sorting domain-containing protein [Bacteroidota bacterium]
MKYRKPETTMYLSTDQNLSRGIYYYKITTGGFEEVKKMILNM